MYAIEIANKPFEVKEYKSKRVVTFKDIDTVHGRPEGTARKRFNDNKKHFINGEDYFVRNSDEAKKEFGITAPNGLILITESGYLMLVKSFTDDLAWDVQRQLVKNYFRAQEVIKRRRKPKLIEEPPYVYYNKRYEGKPVLSDKDLAHMLGVPSCHIRFLTPWGDGKDYPLTYDDFYYFKPADKYHFYHFNPDIPEVPDPLCLHMFPLSGVIKIMDHYNTNPYALYYKDDLSARMLRHMGFEFDIMDMLAHVAGISTEELMHICGALKRFSEYSEQDMTQKIIAECADIVLK